MRHDPLYLLWEIRSPSAEACRNLRQSILAKILPQATVEDEVVAWPDGLEACQTEIHHVSDYFDSIRMLPGPEAASVSFRLLFQRHSGAGRFWKDLMVRVLATVRDPATDATVTLVYQGDEEPEVAAADHS